jgi:hypothetical protein
MLPSTRIPHPYPRSRSLAGTVSAMDHILRATWIRSSRLPLPEGRVRDEHSVLELTLGRSRGVPRRLATFDSGIWVAVAER